MAKKKNKEAAKQQPEDAEINRQEKSDEKEYVQYQIGDEFYGEIIKSIFYARKNHFLYQTVGSEGIAYAVSNPKGNLSGIIKCLVSFNRRLQRPIDKKRFVFKVATAMHLAYEAKEKESVAMCNELIEDIKEYANNLRNGRVTYLLTVVTLLVLAWLAVIVWDLFPIAEQISDSKGLVGAALLGLTGGFFSIVTGLNNIDFYYENSKKVFALTGLSRVIISTLAGVLLFVMVKSNLVLGFLTDTENSNPYVILVFATVAGFSESFIPNILNSIEKNGKNQGEPAP